MTQPLHFAMVCASNMNRSMEAHLVLQRAGLKVDSFGVGGHVKLPGPSQREPNIYAFGTPYTKIYADLVSKDSELYTRNGLLTMLSRNIDIKTAPEKFQLCMTVFDVVITFEERVMDQVMEDLHHRTPLTMQPILVVNLLTQLTAHLTANRRSGTAMKMPPSLPPQALKLCQMLGSVPMWEDAVDDIIKRFEAETGQTAIYTICFV
ncbi:MAG: hypothetical protein WDW36_007478 [Sanguina aurantia]